VHDSHLAAFNEAIDDCLELYRTSAAAWQECVSPEAGRNAPELMEELARGLLVKIFLTVVQADRRFCAAERELAQALIARLWNRRFAAHEVGPVLQGLAPMADKFDWYRLLRPFEIVPVLQERVGEVETVVMRFANLVAKADGTLNEHEARQLKSLLAEIHRHLRPIPFDNSGDLPVAIPITMILPGGQPAAQTAEAVPQAALAEAKPELTRQERLAAAMQSLDELVGLGNIKSEVRSLTRFLQVQQHREQAGLPKTQVSVHSVFMGNPGTGKTSVARILGEVFGALGIVSRGHLVEADRSTLVAGYMGQTADRTNKVIDKALDGILFIDEAYSLISHEGDDPYGHEALQILLKRMEDNRDRLVVILAGYPYEMQRLLAANPGLSSRFSRTFSFPDYSVVELCAIFHSLCKKNHYVLPPETRARLILGFDAALAQRDEHFGNGRLVRNVFENAILRLANRVADIVPLTTELLTRMEPDDIVVSRVAESVVAADVARTLQVAIICPGCGRRSRLRGAHLGRNVQCPRCQVRFTADWGDPWRGKL
jgi:tellurite resistance protein